MHQQTCARDAANEVEVVRMKRPHRSRYVPSRHNKSKVMAALATRCGNENKRTMDFQLWSERRRRLQLWTLRVQHPAEQCSMPASLSVSQQCEPAIGV